MNKNSTSCWRMLASVSAALVFVSGCASDNAEKPVDGSNHSVEESSGAAAVAQPVDGEVIRGETDYDYNVASSVVEAAKAAESAVAGRVTGWSEGRVVQTGDVLLKSAVLEVQAEASFTSSEPPKTVFVEVQRGATFVDENGQELEPDKGSRYVASTVSELAEAAPIGTRVIVLGLAAQTNDEIDKEPAQKLLEPWKPAHPDAQLWSPTPQGLLFENEDGSYVSGVADQADVEFGEWPARNRMGASNAFDQLIDQLSTLKRS